ncbi:zinc knuckle CX2CX4HX4C containing protein [Tanacetum coccineum]
MEEASKRHIEQDEWLKKFYQSTEISREAHDKIIQGLETKVKTLANEVEGRVNNEKFEECNIISTEDGSPLYTPFYYSLEDIEYFSSNLGFSDNEKQEIDNSGMVEALAALEATLKIRNEEPKEEKQKEALEHKPMKSLKKIKMNHPLLKEIRQTDNYAKYMKDLVENKPRTKEDEEIRMNTRCSALLQNHLPFKEQDLGRKLDFSYALVYLGASISVMPLSMYKCLGIGKLEPLSMVIEMADNTKCTPKGIVEILLVKIDKFIFPVDFMILDMVEDLRMPIILGRPLLATAHAKVDIFRKSISLEVGSEKEIFKIRSSFTTTFKSVRSIRSDTCPEDNDFKNINYDLILYDLELYEFNRLLSIDPDIFSYKINVQESYEEIVYRITEIEKKKQSRPKERRVHWCKAILQEKENGSEYWLSCDPNHDVCNGGDSPISKMKWD